VTTTLVDYLRASVRPPGWVTGERPSPTNPRRLAEVAFGQFVGSRTPTLRGQLMMRPKRTQHSGVPPGAAWLLDESEHEFGGQRGAARRGELGTQPRACLAHPDLAERGAHRGGQGRRGARAVRIREVPAGAAGGGGDGRLPAAGAGSADTVWPVRRRRLTTAPRAPGLALPRREAPTYSERPLTGPDWRILPARPRRGDALPGWPAGHRDDQLRKSATLSGG
jgi:hypothetical protein